MKVLVADKFEQSGIQGLKDAGCEVVYEPDLKDDGLAEAIKASGADVLVVRSTKVTSPMLDAGRLSLIVRAGAGYNTIDVAGASKRGIYVSNCPGKNAIAVAELAFALILSLDRRVPDNVAELRAGKWNKKDYSKAQGLYGKTLGLLGAGSIAQEMIRRAAGFGLKVVLWSRRFNGEQRPITEDEARELGIEQAMRATRIDLAATPGDVGSARRHSQCPSRTWCGHSKPDQCRLTGTDEAGGHVRQYLAWRSRGPCRTGGCRSAEKLRVGLDVFASEPAAATGDFQDDLLALPGVYGTHHIGASTDQAQEAIAAETVRIVRSYKETGRVPNVVNLAKRTPATHMLVVRHHDRPGVLAHVFDELREANLNVQETENIVFEGAEAAVARINLDGPPSEQVCGKVKKNQHVLDLQVVKL